MSLNSYSEGQETNLIKANRSKWSEKSYSKMAAKMTALLLQWGIPCLLFTTGL